MMESDIPVLTQTSDDYILINTHVLRSIFWHVLFPIRNLLTPGRAPGEDWKEQKIIDHFQGLKLWWLAGVALFPQVCYRPDM